MMKTPRPLLLPLLSAACMGLGCAGASASVFPNGAPVPQRCPPRAVGAMEDALNLRVRAVTFGDADIRQVNQIPARLVEGPVEGRVTDTLGHLVEGTRLFGHVWTADPEVIIRYHEAELPSGQRLPVCIVALESFGGLKKLPGSTRKVALVQDNGIGLRIVDVYP